MIQMTKTLAKEWGRMKVNVNAVAFGYIETRLTQALAGEDSKTVDIEGRQIKVGIQQAMVDSAKHVIPLGRPGTPVEAAGAVVRPQQRPVRIFNILSGLDFPCYIFLDRRKWVKSSSIFPSVQKMKNLLPEHIEIAAHSPADRQHRHF